MSEDPSGEPKSEAVEKAERISKIFEDTKVQLQTEEHFVNFLKNLSEESKTGFINYYAGLKAMWYKYAEDKYRYRNNIENRYYKKALEKFIEIFQKKLFNMKCRWVAGEMDLPGIEISSDFDRFLTDPASCTFVEPINSKEFECLMQFIQTDNWIPPLAENETDDGRDDDYYYMPESAFDLYHHSRSTYHERTKHEVPLWFRFYDSCFGTADLLNLPHIRTDLEEDYMDIWHNEIYIHTLTPEQLKSFTKINREMLKLHQENPEARAKFQEEQNLKWENLKKEQPNYISLSTYNDAIMEELIPLIETREIIKYYRAEREWTQRYEKTEWIDAELIYLAEAKEYIPVSSNDDYTVAIHEAYENYEQKEILECLPMVFENYLTCVRNKKPFTWLIGESHRNYYNENRNRILAARKWKGEPENLDFLKKENLPDNY